MKKVAILTFHTACNFGAVLQAYALQEVISAEDGFEGHILDYRSDSLEKRHKPAAYLRRKGKLVNNFITFVLCFPDLIKRDKIFRRFRQENFKIEKAELKKSDLKSVNDMYNAFIVGSDQVWNRDIIKGDDTFFLDFVDDSSKKYSYAASIGTSSFSEKELHEYVENINSFKRISVREEDVVGTFSSAMQREVVSSLDPVFLFGSDNWRKFSSYSKRKPYVLYFMMGMSASAVPSMEFAKKLAKEKNLNLVFLSDNERWYKFRDAEHYGLASPDEFVGLIDNAEYVVTNSFHATAFSIILHTPFFTETAVLRSNRITSLLELTGLSDCGLTKGQPVRKPDEIINVINWDSVDENINRKAAESKAYLHSILSDLK